MKEKLYLNSIIFQEQRLLNAKNYLKIGVEKMFIGAMKVTFRAAWIHSLKEKRMLVQHLVSRTRNKFNVSIHEVKEMDTHQCLVLGVALVSNSRRQLDSTLHKVLQFMEGSTEAELIASEIEIL